MTFRRSLSAVAVLATAATLTVACGSSSSKSGGGGTPTSSSKLTGKPVEVNINFGVTGSITFPQVNAAIHAAQTAINNAGGIKGRPLQVDICDGKSPTDPTPSVECVRKAAANQNVVAEVGDYSSFGDQTTPILHDAGVVDIAPVPLAAPQLSLDNSFPLMGTEGGGLGVLMADQGSKKIGLAYIDIPAGSQSIGFGNLFLGKGRGGLKYDKTVPIPLTATDVTPQVASLSGSDGVALSLAPTQVAQFLKAWQGNFKYTVGVPSLAALPEQLDTLGSAADGVFVVSGLPLISSDNPGIARFKKEMNDYDSKASQDTTSLNAWMAVHAFAEVANKDITGEVTRAAVLTAWKSLTNLDLYGLLPPDLNLQKSPIGVAALSRLTNVWVQYGKIKAGKIEDLSHGWVSLLEKK